MKLFQQRDIRRAMAYAATGSQALHLHRVIVDRSRSPRCFIAALDRGESLGHLIDNDLARLEATARHLGVQRIVVERRGRRGQHVDLVGAPLRKALEECGHA